MKLRDRCLNHLGQATISKNIIVRLFLFLAIQIHLITQPKRIVYILLLYTKNLNIPKADLYKNLNLYQQAVHVLQSKCRIRVACTLTMLLAT